MLRLSPAFDVIGTLIPRRLWPQTPGTAPSVQLYSDFSHSLRMSLADVAPDGSFTIKNVPPGRYTLSVVPLPENTFIQSVQNSGMTTSGRIVDISEAGAKLKVIVSDQGAEISGTVRGPQGDLLPLLARVFLQPAQAEPRIENSLLSRIDGQGKYNIKAVPPGTYRLFALGLEKIGPEADRDGYTRAFKSGEIVVVKAAARITRDLKSNSAGGADAVAK